MAAITPRCGVLRKRGWRAGIPDAGSIQEVLLWQTATIRTMYRIVAKAIQLKVVPPLPPSLPPSCPPTQLCFPTSDVLGAGEKAGEHHRHTHKQPVT